MAGFDDICNTGLVLGLGFSSSSTITTTTTTTATTDHQRNSINLQKQKSSSTPVLMMNFEPSLTLSLSGETNYDKKVVDDRDDQLCRQDSAASSFSNVSVKREREIDVETTTDQKGGLSSKVISDEDEDGVNGRKKLRLTKAQSAFLEESFKTHSTLNPKQKQDLARELNLRPRQVEVWFQNRRARTKLKQTEVDCEFLKKCCETLTDENRRLQKELQELKALKQLSSSSTPQPFFMQLPAATLTMCPSCERIGGGGGGGAITDQNNNPSKNTFNNIAPKHHLFNPFTNPSAAC